MEITEDTESFDGFIIWFDSFFIPSRDAFEPLHLGAQYWKKQKGVVAFTTGPEGPGTHWRQGVLLIDQTHHERNALRKGSVIQGSVGYKKRDDNPRELDIEVSWKIGSCERSKNQVWFMR